MPNTSSISPSYVSCVQQGVTTSTARSSRIRVSMPRPGARRCAGDGACSSCSLAMQDGRRLAEQA